MLNIEIIHFCVYENYDTMIFRQIQVRLMQVRPIYKFTQYPGSPNLLLTLPNLTCACAYALT